MHSRWMSYGPYSKDEEVISLLSPDIETLEIMYTIKSVFLGFIGS